MPRYCADIIFLVSLPAPHHHRRSRAGHRPAEIGRDLGVPHLAATALAIIESVLPSAIRPDRTVVVRIMAELADILDHHRDAMGVALAEMTARRIVRPFAAELDGAVGHIVTTLALPTETVILELQHRGEGERV